MSDHSTQGQPHLKKQDLALLVCSLFICLGVYLIIYLVIIFLFKLI